MKINKNVKKLIAALGTFSLILSLSIPAFAGGSAESPTETFTVDGREYEAIASIYTSDPKYVEYRTWISTTDGETVPSGYMGASSKLYDSDENLIKSTSMTYTDSATSGIGVGSVVKLGSGGAYYTWGKVKAYGPSTSRYTSRTVISPLQNRSAVSTSQKLADEYLEALESDGMIKAKSVDNLNGWIFVDDLEDVSSVLEEQFKADSSNSLNDYINVYDEDGTTIIGQFEVTVGDAVYK